MINCKVLISTSIRTNIVLFCMMAFLFSAQAQRRMQSNDAARLPAMESPTTSTQQKDTAKAPTGKSDKIEDIIKYRANDSIILMGNGTAFLHGDTEINYQAINLKADFVKVKIDSSLIYAIGTEGEDGEMIGEPIFSEGEDAYNSKELRYNLRTKKGYIRHVVTQEGEGYIISENTKKSPDNIFSISNLIAFT